MAVPCGLRQHAWPSLFRRMGFHQARGVVELSFKQKQGVDTKNLPFLVRRSPSGNLPVYIHITQKGERVTRVRKVFGDAEHLAQEVGRLCGTEARVRQGTRKTVEVIGTHTDKVKLWLQSLGL
mmetsp:Transcript_49860/g.112230  ORF Transcript_49860/g.112230 Transcript_49860/m.112230 type:complete len:123 (-) Transcript_49860:225-593(-)